MLNHKFSLYNCKLDEEYHKIRISNKFIQEMVPNLLLFKFTWDGYSVPQYGLSDDFTIIQPTELAQLKFCLMRQTNKNHEYMKLMKLIQEAEVKQFGLLHQDGTPGTLAHYFMLCGQIPQEISLGNYVDCDIKIPDQFILEYSDIFKTVPLYWGNLSTTGPGFNYYGVTLISPEMAQSLLIAMKDFLKNDTSEFAEYFLGEEYDMLRGLLKKSISNNQYLVHFGV